MPVSSPVPPPLPRAERDRALARPPAALRPSVLALAALLAACASRGGPPPEDATRDPEFQRALRDREQEFTRQREALEAGIYETFVPPESVAAGGAPAGEEDPTTDELLRTLPRSGAPAAPAGPASAVRPDVPAPEPSRSAAAWTLQLGAFADPAAARRRAEEARRAASGYEIVLAARAGLTKVLLGRFATRADAERALRALEGRGLGAAWVTTADP